MSDSNSGSLKVIHHCVSEIDRDVSRVTREAGPVVGRAALG
jgi:hypothetical protein